MQLSPRQLVTLLACVVFAPLAYAALYQFHNWYLTHPNGHVFALCATVLLAGVVYLVVAHGDDSNGSF